MNESGFIRNTLADLKAEGLYRSLVTIGSAAGPHVTVGGQVVLQFASNNYLGLANDLRVREAAVEAVKRWGWGAGASRLLSGHTEVHAALEAELAAFKHTEAALVFPTGYMTNLGLVTALVGRGDCVFADRANHASLVDAVKLSGAQFVRYPHGDVGAATRAIKKRAAEPGRRVLVTDTVFSMDGDLAPLAALAELCAATGTMLVLDEAHATGVLGPTGAGLAEEIGLAGSSVSPTRERRVTSESSNPPLIASVGTLSKALGGIGGFVAASREVCELLVNRARSFIYSTALPAAACEAARAALRIVRDEPERRQRVLDLAEGLRAMLRENGFDTGASVTPIVPILVGEPERALALAAALLAEGIFCPAIRPPTVPRGTSRLRVSLTAEHTEEDLARLVAALVKIRG